MTTTTSVPHGYGLATAAMCGPNMGINWLDQVTLAHPSTKETRTPSPSLLMDLSYLLAAATTTPVSALPGLSTTLLLPSHKVSHALSPPLHPPSTLTSLPSRMILTKPQ